MPVAKVYMRSNNVNGNEIMSVLVRYLTLNGIINFIIILRLYIMYKVSCILCAKICSVYLSTLLSNSIRKLGTGTNRPRLFLLGCDTENSSGKHQVPVVYRIRLLL